MSDSGSLALRPGEERLIAKAAGALREGGVVLCPAEGVYGLSCLCSAQDALSRILALKGRAADKGFICVTDDVTRLSELLDLKSLTQRALGLMKRFWPGPYTFLLPAAKMAPALLTGGRGKLAVRVTAFPALRCLCALVAAPLVSTSANISGEAATAAVGAVDPTIRTGCDFVLDLPCGGHDGATAIYDLVSSTLIRPGPRGPEEFL